MLSKLLVYFISLFSMPRKVEHRLDNFFKDFQWHDKVGNRKHHLMSWKCIAKANNRGGVALVFVKGDNCILI